MGRSRSAKRSRTSGPYSSTHLTGRSLSIDSRQAKRTSTQQEYQRNVESQPLEDMRTFLATISILERDEEYSSWMRSITDYLMIEGYGPLLRKRKPRPSDEDKEALEDYLDKHERAISAVLSRISLERRLKLEVYDQVDLLLEAIESKFKPTGSFFLMKRSEELFKLTRDQCKSVSDYSSRLLMARDDCQMCIRDTFVSDTTLVVIFLLGLGPSYANFKTNFLNKFNLTAVDGDGAPTVKLWHATQAAEQYERLMKMYGPKTATSK